MPTSKAIKSANTLLAYAAGNVPAATPVRMAIDLRESIGGGILTGAITNAANLTAQCVATVYVAHTTGATPAVNDAAWKPVQQLATAGLNSGAKQTFAWIAPAGMPHLMIEFAGNTGGACSAEAAISTLDGINTTA